MKISDFFPLLGLSLLAVRQWLDSNGHALPEGLKPEWLTWGGLAFICVGVAARVPQMIRAAGARRMKYGSNSAIFIVVVFGILAALNWMAYRDPKRLDLSKDQKFSISEQTRKLLDGLGEDLTISLVQRAEAAAGPATVLLRQYEAASPRVKLEFIDPMKEPGRARALDVAQLPTIVVALGDRTERVLTDSEEDITNAVLKLTRTVTKTVCFATGEGQRDSEDPSEHGYSAARSALSKSQYEIRTLVLLQEQKVPEDCTVLVVPGPERDLLPEAAGYIKSFVRAGGKAMLMVDPIERTQKPNYESVFTEFGVTPGKDVVVDASGIGQLFGTGPFMPIVTDYPFHAVNKDLKDTMSAFDMARSMTPITPVPEGVVVQELARTSKNSWGESDTTLTEPIAFSDQDARGPLNLAAAVTVRAGSSTEPSADGAAAPAVGTPAKEGRIIAVGDSGFASNSLLTFQANQDLFMNMISWLAEDADLISIRPKDPEVHSLALTVAQQRNMVIFSLFILPGFFIVWGIVNWWRRRS